MKPTVEINAPWSLSFLRNGTEDVGVITDVNGEELVQSSTFWLPEKDDPIPATLTALRLMVAAPSLHSELNRSNDLLWRETLAASRSKDDARANRLLRQVQWNLEILSCAEGRK